MATYILFILGLFSLADSAPLNPKSGSKTEFHIDPRLARTIRDSSMLGKVYDFSFCADGLSVSLGHKRINRKGVRLTSSDAVILAEYLHGESIEERIEVWCKTAHMSALLALSIGKKWATFTIEELDRYQGDIIIGVDQADEFLGLYKGHDPPSLRPRHNINKRDEFAKWKISAKEAVKSRPKRKVIFGSVYEWDNQVVPWRFDPRSKFDKSARGNILAAIEHWESNTCFRMPMVNSPQGEHIVFVKRRLCFSAIGRRLRGSYGQEVSIGDGCLLLGIVAHEIGHVLGLFHEQSRPDRDRYVEILTNNIQTAVTSNFMKQSWRTADTAGIPYDYASAMHYGRADFTRRENADTIRPKQPYLENTIGQREGLSYYDIKAVNFKFCSKSCGQRSLEWDKCENGGYRDPRNCRECRCPTGFSPPYCKGPARSGKVDCGRQVLDASLIPKSLASPGYGASGHPSDSGCSWLIQAPPGHRVELTFTGKFEMHRPDKTLQCEDGYVEVKYQDIARNGPRFCYDRPQMTLKSEHPQMVVRTRVGKSVPGFSAQFRAVLMECGGCEQNSGDQESACMATELTDCSRVSPFRLNNCFQSAPRCCDGYRLDGSLCIRDNTSSKTTAVPTTTSLVTTADPTKTDALTKITTEVPTTEADALTTTVVSTTTKEAPITKTDASTKTTTEVPTTKANALTTTTEVPATETEAPTTAATTVPTTGKGTTGITLEMDPMTTKTSIETTTKFISLSGDGWGEWGSYGTCSNQCGNCGVSVRRRKCIDPPCRGHSVSIKRCPDTPCPDIPRTKICIDKESQSSCGWWRPSLNRRPCVRTKICIEDPAPCCHGRLEDNRCVIEEPFGTGARNGG